MLNYIAGIFAAYGFLAYPVIFVWTFFEGETVVIFGGYAAYSEILNASWLFVLAWLGSFLGDQLWYYIGRYYGPRLLDRFPKWQRGSRHVSTLMHRYGVWFILTFRFAYGVRNVSSFTIGMVHYPRLRFLGLNFVAAGVWAAAFVGLGYGFGALTDAVTVNLPDQLLGDFAKAFGLGALGVFVLVVVLLLRHHKKKEEEAEAAEDTAARALAAPDALQADRARHNGTDG